ncbi:hypothetical protein Tcan_14704 [Toxocara canis]|uniref:Uncharacterized protein n=1 Tax=Toxocara canis TaxID=6265 RepID=A0A0B2V170_TOXCA|nr:hypothetical protein Tcan_14704 [Toxocara canis]
MKTHRKLPSTPSIDATPIVNGFSTVAIEPAEGEQVRMRRKLSRATDWRHSWTPTQPSSPSMAERRQLSINVDNSNDPYSPSSAQNSPTLKPIQSTGTTPRPRNFLTVDQGLRAVSPVGSRTALQRRIQYLQTKQVSFF